MYLIFVNADTGFADGKMSQFLGCFFFLQFPTDGGANFVESCASSKKETRRDAMTAQKT